MIDEKAIKANFVNESLQKLRFIIYDTTDSTNTRAKQFAEEHPNVKEAVFIAEHQSLGRGRMGRSFDSEAGAGLYITFLIRSSAERFDPALLTVRAATDTAEAIKRASGLDVKIKWVNDIIADGRKLAGILAEGKIDPESGTAEYAVIGIGINLYKRDFPSDISSIAISLEQACGARISREKLAAALTEEIYRKKRFDEVISEYRKRSSVIGERITVRRIGGEAFEATAEQILENGALLVRRESGEYEELISAEVSIRKTTDSKRTTSEPFVKAK